MFVAPGLHGHDDRLEVAAAFSQDIFVAWRAFAIAAFFQHPGLDQRSQAPRQHVGRDAKAFFELVKACQSVQGVADDQHAPPFPDPLEAAGDRALQFSEAFVSHCGMIGL